jgi:hypothetical protein
MVEHLLNKRPEFNSSTAKRKKKKIQINTMSILCLSFSSLHVLHKSKETSNWLTRTFNRS